MPDHQARGVKRSVEEETLPPAKRTARALESNLVEALQHMSISPAQSTPQFMGELPFIAMPTCKRNDSALDRKLTDAFEHMSISTVQKTPQFMGGLPIHTVSPAKRTASALDSNLTTAFKDISIKTVQRTPQLSGGLPTKRPCSALLEYALQDMSVSSAQETPLFMGGLPVQRLSYFERLPPRQPSYSLNAHLSPTPLSRHVPIYTPPEYHSSHTRAKRAREEDIEQAPVPKSVKRPKNELPIRSAIASDAYCAVAHANSTLDTKSSPQSLQQSPFSEPTHPKIVGLMDLPSEVRLRILSHGLNSTVGPSGTISVNPRADILSNPSGRFAGYAGQSKWQARRSMLQTCHTLREEALEVLYNEHTFFARMTQRREPIRICFEQRKFRRWLRSLGGDVEVRRVRKVTFGVEWPSFEQGGRWVRRKGNVDVCISRGKAVVGGSQRIAECRAAPLRQLQSMVGRFMVAKAVGEGLGYVEWMLVWDLLQELMESGWGSPY